MQCRYFENHGRPWPCEWEGPTKWEGFSFQNNDAALCNFNNKVVLFTLLGQDVLAIDE